MILIALTLRPTLSSLAPLLVGSLIEFSGSMNRLTLVLMGFIGAAALFRCSPGVSASWPSTTKGD